MGAHREVDDRLDTQELFDVLNKENDLSCVLIAHSFLDECLRRMLLRKLVHGTTSKKALNKGWLGTYSARVEAAYVLGLITKGLRHNLEVLGQLRNKFAHGHRLLGFDQPDVVNLCMKLQTPAMRSSFRVGADNRDPVPTMASNSPRNYFVHVVAMMAARLMLIELSVEPITRCGKGWEESAQ